MDAVLRYWNFDVVPAADGTVCTWQLNAGVSLFAGVTGKPAATAWLTRPDKVLNVRAFFEMLEPDASAQRPNHSMNVTIIIKNSTETPLKTDGIVKLWNPLSQTLEEAKFLGTVTPSTETTLSTFNVTLCCMVGERLSPEDPFSCNMYIIVGLYPEKPIGVLECRKPLTDPLLSRDEFSDFRIIVEDLPDGSNDLPGPSQRVINVHKVVLAANSPVFANMFNLDMKEKRDNSSKIQGYPFETVSLFVDILYSRTKFPEATDFQQYSRLLQIADQYNVVDVKNACETRLTQLVSPDNVCDVVEVAYVLGCEQLQSVCWQLLAKHRKRSLRGWTDLRHRNPSFVCTLLEDVEEQGGESASMT